MKLSEVKTLISGATVEECTFPVAGIEFIKFSEENGVAVVIAKDCVFDSDLGKNNNFSESKALKRLNNEILPKLEAEVGAENIKEFELDLTSFDGLDTYGIITTKIGIPTMDFYRANVRLFDKCKIDCYWWLATPDTTPEHLNDRWALCVSPQGCVSDDVYDSRSGVRPFLHFVSSISVSCED